MSLEKIKDVQPPCLYPEHHPPNMIVLKLGTYKYTCPAYGKVTIFTVSLITC